MTSRRDEYLQAMGIQVWKQRSSSQIPEQAQTQTQIPAPDPVQMDELSDTQPLVSDTMPEQKPPPLSAPTPPMATSMPLPLDDGDSGDNADDRSTKIAGMDWPALINEVEHCQACSLHASRTRAVFGVGNRQADWMIIGEAPGADEDRLGEPFVGRAGK